MFQMHLSGEYCRDLFYYIVLLFIYISFSYILKIFVFKILTGLTFTHLLTCILLFNLFSHLLVFTVYLPLKMQMWFHPVDGSSWLKLRLASIFMSGCLPEVTVPTVVCLPLSAVGLDLKGLAVYGSVRDSPCVCLYACVWDKEVRVWV